MVEKADRSILKDDTPTVVRFKGKSTSQADFNARSFARSIVRGRKGSGGKSIIDREAWQRKAEAKIGR